jgi:hypothetical protein
MPRVKKPLKNTEDISQPEQAKQLVAAVDCRHLVYLLCFFSDYGSCN